MLCRMCLERIVVAVAFVAGSARVATVAAESAPARPPAVPLVACDPYFSVWSFADRLTDDATRHWTGKRHALSALVRIDGKAWRLMGPGPEGVPALPQVGLGVLPTRTIYEFEGPEAHITLTFLTPALLDDLDVLARPVTYLTWDVRSRDGREHAASLYFSAAAELAVDSPRQRVTWDRAAVEGLEVLRAGSEDQAVLAPEGGRPADRLGPPLRRGAAGGGPRDSRARRGMLRKRSSSRANSRTRSTPGCPALLETKRPSWRSSSTWVRSAPRSCRAT